MSKRTRMVVSLPPDLASFWEEKRREMLRSQDLDGLDELTNTQMFEALVSHWRAADRLTRQNATKISHKEDGL